MPGIHIQSTIIQVRVRRQVQAYTVSARQHTGQEGWQTMQSSGHCHVPLCIRHLLLLPAVDSHWYVDLRLPQPSQPSQSPNGYILIPDRFYQVTCHNFYRTFVLDHPLQEASGMT